jgi:hypothetical protein
MGNPPWWRYHQTDTQRSFIDSKKLQCHWRHSHRARVKLWLTHRNCSAVRKVPNLFIIFPLIILHSFRPYVGILNGILAKQYCRLKKYCSFYLISGPFLLRTDFDVATYRNKLCWFLCPVLQVTLFNVSLFCRERISNITLLGWTALLLEMPLLWSLRT